MARYTISAGSDECDGRVAVIDGDDGGVEGCYETPEEAQAAIDELEANGDPDDMAAASTGLADDPLDEFVPGAPFIALLAVEEEPTGDGRVLGAGSITWRDLPLPFMVQDETPQGGLGGNPHGGARIAARIDEIYRDPIDERRIMATGFFDVGGDGQNAQRLVGDRTLRGVSVDLADVTAEPECLEEGADGECVSEQWRMSAAKIMGATITPFPAIASAQISLVASMSWAESQIVVGTEFSIDAAPLSVPVPAAVVRGVVEYPRVDAFASTAPQAAPLVPPREWFENPAFERPTPQQITPDGRIFGHLAAWGQCHRGFVDRTANRCVTAPMSRTAYAHFALGSTLARCCDSCDDPPVEITTGAIVMGTLHADLGLNHRQAQAFYEDTGRVAAHVATGEDEFGIWFTGALNPAITAEQIWTLRGAQLSGDWRRISGGLELVAMLAVNMPGFEQRRPKVHFGADGMQTALVASLAPEAGDVTAPPPSWREYEALRTGFEDLRGELARVRSIADPLRGLAAEQIALGLRVG